MKPIVTVLFTFGLLVTAQAQEAIKVEVTFIEHPAAMIITKEAWQHGKALKQRGVHVLGTLVATTPSGRLATLKAVDVRSVPSGGSPADGANWQRKVEIGPELRVQPTVRGDTIEFSATATLRVFEGVRPVGDAVAASEFTSHEFYFGGNTKSGETLFLPSKSTAQKKRVTLVVTFTKV
jgi:hypothetical protein